VRRRGHARAHYPQIAAELVRLDIDSISLNPDVVIRTTMNVLALERELAAREKPAARAERAVA